MSSLAVLPEKNEQSDRCRILAKKGFLSVRNLTSGLAILLYSREFQLGVLFTLPPAEAGCTNFLSEEQTFAKSAIAMILSEFQTLGVPNHDLLTYAIGGSATGELRAVSPALVRQTLSSHGLNLTASDLGGNQIRSIWMDVETGRTIIRSESTIAKTVSSGKPQSVAC